MHVTPTAAANAAPSPAQITPHLTPEQLDQLQLSSGAHSDPDEGHCLLEVVSLFAGEPFSDSPACVDPVLAEFGRAWNDGMRSDAERAQLKRYIPLLPGSASGPALSEARAWLAMDWLVRTNLPAWLELSPGLAEHAAKLRALAPITGEQGLALAQPTLDHAARDAAAARAAAWAAASGDEYSAARTAADAALAPTCGRLQLSAHDLYLRMINLRAADAAAADAVSVEVQP